MTKWVKVIIAVIMIALFCLNSLQLPLEAGTSTEQSLLIEHLPFDEHATFLKENHQAPTFFSFLFMLCIIFTLLFVRYRSKIRRFLFSVIPILKQTFLLYPIHFESRYIVVPPFHLAK
ncbi:hypothetical protein ADS79_19070 [Brevibacillus reuszeri]|uniref:Uncharacterized protein n=1 Tax=Brevibacillus reuszeri TaxID=54915 RepID=A0A0K9YQD0_9BACL|nr:hypothetical protein ADS79_19070 [Brevibacillus reuszeri]